MESVFGTAGPIVGHNFAGKTDAQIARELLHGAGLGDEEIEAGFSRLWDKYLSELEARLPEEPMSVLPGVRSLLEHLQELPDVALGLLTGNIKRGARLKLASAELTEFFSVGGFGAVGGFGSDSEVREELTAYAIKRAAEEFDTDFAPQAVVVIGDTPRDVACGKFGGTRTVAVATGRYDAQELMASGPDRILGDFRDLRRSWEALLA
jgi:phosphoglycolate phosphatase-like HAD superfamily hydrolase